MTKPPDDFASEKSSWARRNPQIVAIVFAFASLVYFCAFLLANEVRGRPLGLWMMEVVLFCYELPYWWGGSSDFSRLGILDRIPLLLAAAIILGVAYLAGRLLMNLSKAESLLTTLETTVFAIGAGLNVLSLYVLIAGLAGGLRSRLVILAPLALVVMAAVVYRRKLFHRAPGCKRDSQPSTPGNKKLLWLGVPFAITILAGSLLPPWHFDSREYHMQIPKEWYQQGRIDFVPHNVYGNMPLGAEVHSITGMNMFFSEEAWWYGSLVGKAVIASYALLTALLLYAFGIRYFCERAGAIAALVFISTPWIAYVSYAGLIDGAVAFYLAASCYAFLIWREKRSDRQGSSFGLVALTGFLAGSSVACKYPAVVFVVVPIGIAVLLMGTRRFDWRAAIAFGIAVAIACGPWFIKNAALAGNPTYPLLADVFGGKTRTPEKIQQWQRAHRVPAVEGGHAFTLAHLRGSAVQLLVQSDYASPLLVPLMLVSIFVRKHRRLLVLIGAMIAFNLVSWWCLTHRVDRFLVPILPLVALLCAAGATWSDNVLWRRLVNGLILGFVLFNLLFVVSPLCSQDVRFLVSYDEIRRDIPHHPNHYDANRVHPAHRYLNEKIVPGYRALLVGEAQVFDLEIPILYNTCFDDCVFEKNMKGRTTEQRLAVFREQRISHVFIFWQELARYREPGNYDYSDYVTRDLIQREFVATGILQEVPLPTPRESSQLFEVRGWRDWQVE